MLAMQNEAITLDPERLWNAKEARYYLRVSDSTLRTYMRDGRLPALRIGGSKGRTLLFRKTDLDALIVPVDRSEMSEALEDEDAESEE